MLITVRLVQYNYCVWIETLVYGQFSKIIAVPYQELFPMVSLQYKMLLRHEDPSTIILRYGELSSDEESFMKEMGRIMMPNISFELSRGRYAPLTCSESHDNYINVLSAGDTRLNQYQNHLSTQNGLHEKNNGVTSSKSILEIDLIDAPISSIIVSNKDVSTEKYYTSAIVISLNKELSKIYNIYHKDNRQLSLGMEIISISEFKDRLPDVVRVYLETSMAAVSAIITDLSDKIIKTLYLPFQVITYKPVNRIRNSLQVSIGFI